jgi:hypothetical protein
VAGPRVVAWACGILIALCLIPAGCSTPEPAPKQSAKSSGSEQKVAAEPAAFDAASPAARLFDTGAAAAEPLLPEAVAARAGWSLVAEDDVSRPFKGDVVLRNDHLTVVLRQGGDGAEVYAETAAGPKCRAAVVPLPQDAPAPAAPSADSAKRSTFRIIENTTAAVAVEATTVFSGTRTLSVRVRLTTGQPILEVRPGEGAGKLALRGRMDYVVVPDFFSDDRLFHAARIEGSRAGLPAENFFLGLAGGGDAMIMCIWATPTLNADVLAAGDGPARAITGCEVECLPGKPVWLAFMEGHGLWQGRTVMKDASTTMDHIDFDWPKTFAAKWRVSVSRDEGDLSFDAGTEDADRKFKIAMAKAFHVNRTAWSVADHGDRVAGEILQFPRFLSDSGMALVFYAIDRETATPLDVFTPMDALRNTLEVGPCQYILDTEGLTSEEVATPEVVVAWIDKQLQNPDAARAAGEIKARHDAMVAHIGRARQRELRYFDFFNSTMAVMVQKSKSERILKVFERIWNMGHYNIPGFTRGPRDVLYTADQVDEALDAGKMALVWPEVAARLRQIGAFQDRALADCRMAYRDLKQAARAVEWDVRATAEDRELARKIRALCEEILSPEKPPAKP